MRCVMNVREWHREESAVWRDLTMAEEEEEEVVVVVAPALSSMW